MTATAWRPALRQGVVYQLGEGGAASLWDPLFRREVDLGRVAAAVVQRMDGQRGAEAIVQEAAAALGLPREATERSLRTLLLMNLVEGAGADIVARVQRLRAGYVPPPQALPELRFSCQGSGDCCQNYSYGPLLDTDRERLEALPLREAFPALGDGPLFEELEAPDGGAHFYLRSDGDRCLFLLPDCRCGIHARFGAEHKPRLCQDFPLHYTPTVDGARVYDRGECATYSQSSQAGPPLVADPGRLLRLAPAGFDLAEELEHPVVLFDGQTPCDFGHFLRLQDALCARIAASADAGAALLSMAELVAEFAAALRRFPLRAGEPDRTLQALCAAPPSSAPAAPSPGAIARGLEAIGLLCGELLQVAGLRIAASDRHGPPLTSERNMRQLATVVHAASLLTADLAGDLGAPLPGPYQRIAAADATAAEVDELLRRSLRQQAYGGRMLIEGRPLAALLRLGLGFVVTAVGARYSAAAAARARALPADFDHGHLLAMRVLRTERAGALFLAHEARAFDVLAAAPLLAAAAPAAAAPADLDAVGPAG